MSDLIVETDSLNIHFYIISTKAITDRDGCIPVKLDDRVMLGQIWPVSCSYLAGSQYGPFYIVHG